MHNTHYLVVFATRGGEAAETVEAVIVDWGNENNWGKVVAATSEDGETYIPLEGRSAANSIKEIKEEVLHEVKRIEKWYGAAFDKFKDRIPSRKLTVQEWSELERYAQFHVDAAEVDETFDPLYDEYRGWRLDEFGITNLCYDDKQEDEKKWIVEIDMHS